MAIRRAALERIGPFDVSLGARRRRAGVAGTAARRAAPRPNGEPADEDRVSEAFLYVAAAALHHRRSPPTRACGHCAARPSRAGAPPRRFDAVARQRPSLAGELLTLAGCLGHVVRYRCPAGLTMVAHSGGRMREAVPRKNAHAGTRAHAGSDDFLSGESGTVGGLDGVRRAALDIADDALEIALGQPAAPGPRRARAPAARGCSCCASRAPQHRALVERDPRRAGALASRGRALRRCARRPRQVREPQPAARRPIPPDACDWLLVVDDDIVLPTGFSTASVPCRALRARPCPARPPPRFARRLAGDPPRAPTAWCARRASWRSGR